MFTLANKSQARQHELCDLNAALLIYTTACAALQHCILHMLKRT